MSNRPRKAVLVMAADGITWIPFFPSDIKALATLLWSNGKTKNKFVGGRCNDDVPAIDDNNRPTDQSCLDTNAGTWHLSVVNQIGVARRSLIFDATYSSQVWNQPILGYSYNTFNPKTGKVGNLEKSSIAINSSNRKNRSPDATTLVGIIMKFDYVIEASPNNSPINGPENDVINSVSYKYDLEPLGRIVDTLVILSLL